MKNRRGFTLVELLVVIAILAVLATVSIVGYSSFVTKAKRSNDEVLVAQLNNYLNIYNDNISFVSYIVDDLKEDNLDLSNLKLDQDDDHLVYDSINERFLLLSDVSNINDSLYVFVYTSDEIIKYNTLGYGVYLTSNFNNLDITTSKNIDAGNNNINLIINDTDKSIINIYALNSNIAIANDELNINIFGYNNNLDLTVNSCNIYSYVNKLVLNKGLVNIFNAISKLDIQANTDSRELVFNSPITNIDITRIEEDTGKIVLKVDDYYIYKNSGDIYLTVNSDKSDAVLLNDFNDDENAKYIASNLFEMSDTVIVNNKEFPKAVVKNGYVYRGVYEYDINPYINIEVSTVVTKGSGSNKTWYVFDKEDVSNGLVISGTYPLDYEVGIKNNYDDKNYEYVKVDTDNDGVDDSYIIQKILFTLTWTHTNVKNSSSSSNEKKTSDPKYIHDEFTSNSSQIESNCKVYLNRDCSLDIPAVSNVYEMYFNGFSFTGTVNVADGYKMVDTDDGYQIVLDE